jgi:mannobiose 2-epimerase
MVDHAALRDEISSELHGNLLPFWRERIPDHAGGGFVTEMASDATVRDGAARGLILHSRLLWTFAALHRQLGKKRDIELARRAFDVLQSSFRDREHGGYFWRVDAAGRPLERTKKTYGQAFCIYALSEYSLATGQQEPLAAARELFEHVERHAHDDSHGGYIEARGEDWSEASDLRLSSKDQAAAKSMNTHLHLLEAYTNFYRAWPDDTVAARLEELITIFGRHIISHDHGDRHLRHFFDAAWNPQSDTRTYGHDIEAVWLLSEATAALGRAELQATVRLWAIELARSVVVQAVGADGGLAYEGRGGDVINGDRDWWCQAEAVVGLWHAFELTRDPSFADAAVGVWRFIERSMVDRVNGEWFWRVRSDGTIDETEPKVSEWKGPYHSVRMCLEMLRRLNAEANGG